MGLDFSLQLPAQELQPHFLYIGTRLPFVCVLYADSHDPTVQSALLS